MLSAAKAPLLKQLAPVLAAAVLAVLILRKRGPKNAAQ